MSALSRIKSSPGPARVRAFGCDRDIPDLTGKQQGEEEKKSNGDQPDEGPRMADGATVR